MLALMLSGIVGSASLVFFGSAFFAPKLHRKDDFLWSGFGFFYALVLWICAQRVTGAVLLGQLAVVCLLLAFAWQTLRLRAAIANHAIAEVPSFSLLDWLNGGLGRQPKAPKGQSTLEKTAPGKKQKAVAEKTVAGQAMETVDQVLDSIDVPPPVVEAVEDLVETAIADVPIPDNLPPESPISPNRAQESVPENPSPSDGAPLSGSLGDRPKPKSKLFQWLFRGKKQQPPTPPTNIADVIESVEEEDWGEEDSLAETVTPVEEVVAILEEITVEQGPEAITRTETVNQIKAEETIVVIEGAEKIVVAVVENAPEEVISSADLETVVAEVTETAIADLDMGSAEDGETPGREAEREGAN